MYKRQEEERLECEKARFSLVIWKHFFWRAIARWHSIGLAPGGCRAPVAFSRPKKGSGTVAALLFVPTPAGNHASNAEIGCKWVKSAGDDVTDVMGFGFIRFAAANPILLYFWHLAVESHRQIVPRLLAAVFLCLC